MAEHRPRQPVLLTHVDYEGGSSDIELLEGDEPRDAAAAFCRRHGLGDDVIEPLTQHLQNELAQQEPAESTQTETELEGSESLCTDADALYADAGYSDDGDDYGTHDVVAQLDAEDDDWKPAAAAAAAASQPHSAAPSFFQEPSYAPSEDDEQSQPFEHLRTAGTATIEDGRMWGASELSGPSAPRTRHITERLYNNAHKREQRLQEERRLRDKDEKKMRNSYKLTISARSHQLAKNRTEAAGYSNYGERMYVEGVLKQRERMQLTKEAEAEKEAEELAQLETHQRPRVRSAQRRATGGASALDRLTRTRTDKTQERLRDLAKEKEDAAVAECSFAPAINRRSDRLMADRSTVLREHRITAHDQLFQDAGRRASRASEYEHYYPEEVTFHPVINKTRPPKRESAFTAAAAAPVQDRLYSQARKTADKLEAKRKKPPVDLKTGAALFKPSTGRAPLSNRNAPVIPVGNRLFDTSREWEDRKVGAKAQKEQEIKQTMTATHTNAASKAMMGKLKAKRFRQIFQYLEQRSGHDETVELLTMVFGEDKTTMESLDEEVRADVEAAAQILFGRIGSRPGSGSGKGSDSESDEDSPAGEVDLLQFAGLMEEVLKKHRHVRAYLLPSTAPRKKWDEPTFKPVQNARSLALAARRRPAEERGCDILHSIAAIHDGRRQSRKDAALAAEMQSCTFKPKKLSAAPKRRPLSGVSTNGTVSRAAHSPTGSTYGGSDSATCNGDEDFLPPNATSVAYASSGVATSRAPESLATERTAQSVKPSGRRSSLASRRPTPSKSGRTSDYSDLASLNARVMAAMAETAELLPDIST